MVAVGVIVWFSAGMSFFIYDGQTGDSNRLCIRGHQEWRTSAGLMPAGKGVMVPIRHREKVWVCEAWE